MGRYVEIKENRCRYYDAANYGTTGNLGIPYQRVAQDPNYSDLIDLPANAAGKTVEYDPRTLYPANHLQNQEGGLTPGFCLA